MAVGVGVVTGAYRADDGSRNSGSVYAVEGGGWIPIPGSDAATISYTVTGLTNGITYQFNVRAVNSAGNGFPAHVTAVPAGP